MLARATADTMNNSIKEFKKELDTLKKNKGDKKKIAELEKQIDLKCKNFAAKVLGDFHIAKQGCDALTLQIEAYLKNASESVQATKAAAERYKKARANSDKSIVEAAPAHLKSVYDLAKKEMDDYAVTWNCYRSNYGDAVDPKYMKEIGPVREDIIERTKTCRGKTDQIEQMSKEVEPYKAVVADAGALTMATPEEKVEELKKLLTLLQEMAKPLNTGKGTVEAVVNNLETFKGKVKQKKDIIKASMTANEQAYAFNVKSTQGHVSALASMKKALTTGKSAIHQMYLKDPGVAEKIKECDEYVAGWDTKVKEGMTACNEMAKLMTQMQQMFKK